jgi:hypothetical protein
MKSISKIELVLENCESLTVEGKAIKGGFISDIKKNIHLQDTDVFENLYCCQFEIAFENIEQYISYSNEHVKDEIEVMKRLYLKDVTSVVLHFNDSTELQIYVPWRGEDFINKLMKIKKYDNITTLSFTRRPPWYGITQLQNYLLYFKRYLKFRLFRRRKII